MTTHTWRLAAALALAAAAMAACTGESGSAHHARQASATGAAPTLVRGAVASFSPGDLVVRAGTRTMDVTLQPPLHVYERARASLADVKVGDFIGVTTVKQPDGSEQASEVHIFPEALRGLGEGSRMMTQGAAGSRMTNGAVSGTRMTSGAVSGSRLSNGSVAGRNGSSLVVQYAGGSLQVALPADTKVTRLEETSRPLAPGDQVVVLATRAANGSLSTNRVLLSGR